MLLVAASIQLYKPPGARRSLSLVEDYTASHSTQHQPLQQSPLHQQESTDHDAFESAARGSEPLTASHFPSPPLSTDTTAIRDNCEHFDSVPCSVAESGRVPNGEENDERLNLAAANTEEAGDVNNCSSNNNNSRCVHGSCANAKHVFI